MLAQVFFKENMAKKRFKGTVKWFSPEKGFGFISVEGKGEIFVHYTDILSNGFKVLERGQAVELEIMPEKRGLEAKEVRIL